ncbi:MAG: bifunctional transaldolase/phosoglucose isomerase [Terriglobia bacterium]
MAENPLRQLNRAGQSVWFDYIRRWEMVSGHLKRLIDEDGLSGVTSNPSIFEKAIADSKDYDEVIQKLVSEGSEAAQIFETLAVEDIQMAADLFLPTYRATDARDGYVSIEVSPTLARDTTGTIAEARRLYREVNRPNVLVKVPGTVEGLPAIQQLLGEGININITLLFAIARYEAVAEAYIAALEKLAADGKDLKRVASVASFFVSRIDTLVDQQLEDLRREAKTEAEREKISALFGKAAVANAKLAYQRFKEIFAAPRFQRLAQNGARVQRMLWASTSTKNPKYPDTLYAAELIGPDTIDTMPASTLDAFRDHGKVLATIEEGLAESRQVMAQLAEVGVDFAAVTRKLEEQGVEAFAKDYQKLLKSIAEKRAQVLEGGAVREPSLQPEAGSLASAVAATLDKLEEQKFPQRLWDRDASLWKNDAKVQVGIRNALGWLRVSHAMLGHLDALSNFVQEVKSAGFTHAVVLGMGGSSLCPDVCRATFGTAPGFLQLLVLDSTVPASVAQIEKSVDLAHTLFIVSSKSGGTIEPNSFFKYFYERVRALKGQRAGENFVAITDPGTSLEKLASEKKFRRVFPGVPEIGGRYSALSNFGMVPAALAGVDVQILLERAERMVNACGPCVPGKENPGMVLGATLAEAARRGLDKITFVISPGIESFADWVEQLIAESTGKEGKGLVPVAGEALGEPGVYGKDRIFVHIKLDSEAEGRNEQALNALEAAGHPVIKLSLHDKLDLGQEFFRWEVATATAGALLGINPFDQPNVQKSKDNTNDLLQKFLLEGKFGEKESALEADGIQLYSSPEIHASLEKAEAAQGSKSPLPEGYLAAFLNQARPGDYIALLAYLEPTAENGALLESIRTRLRDATHLATALGYGPRYLHSTGQLHKGGANNGLFIQITADDAQDLPIPGEPYGFSILKQAQALGDLGALKGEQRRVIRLHLGRDVEVQLARLEKLVESAVK